MHIIKCHCTVKTCNERQSNILNTKNISLSVVITTVYVFSHDPSMYIEFKCLIYVTVQRQLDAPVQVAG